MFKKVKIDDFGNFSKKGLKKDEASNVQFVLDKFIGKGKRVSEITLEDDRTTVHYADPDYCYGGIVEDDDN